MINKVRCRGYEGILIKLITERSILGVYFYKIKIMTDKNTIINIKNAMENEIEFIEEKK